LDNRTANRLCRQPNGLLSTSGNGLLVSWSETTANLTWRLSCRQRPMTCCDRAIRLPTRPMATNVPSTHRRPARSPLEAPASSLPATRFSEAGHPTATVLAEHRRRHIPAWDPGSRRQTRYPKRPRTPRTRPPRARMLRRQRLVCPCDPALLVVRCRRRRRGSRRQTTSGERIGGRQHLVFPRIRATASRRSCGSSESTMNCSRAFGSWTMPRVEILLSISRRICFVLTTSDSVI